MLLYLEGTVLNLYFEFLVLDPVSDSKDLIAYFDLRA
jgi:hypothetical protein